MEAVEGGDPVAYGYGPVTNRRRSGSGPDVRLRDPVVGVVGRGHVVVAGAQALVPDVVELLVLVRERGLALGVVLPAAIGVGVLEAGGP